MKQRKQNGWVSVISVLTLCIVICAISIFFVYDSNLIGFVLVALAIICLGSLAPFKITVRSVLPDIVFGLIDNGILAILAVLGGEFAGVAGAIVGGVVGNALTDGIAGIFEGHFAEKMRSNKINVERNVLSSAVGKMAGCLLGAGVVLIFASLLRL